MKRKITTAIVLIIAICFVALPISAMADTPVSLDENTDVYVTGGFLHFTIVIRNNNDFNTSINGTWNVSVKRMVLNREFRHVENGSFRLPGHMALERHFFGFGILWVIVVTVDIVETEEHFDFRGYHILGFVIFLNN